MAAVDLFLANPRHHLAMMEPVARALGERHGHRCRLLSLAELRGFRTPRPPGLPVSRFLPVPRPRDAGPSGAPGQGRSIGRRLVWRFVLAPRLAGLLAHRPDLAVLPNDAAWPYDRIAAALTRRGIPFLLLQEGIRFPLPGVPATSSYGRGGAAALAAWGAASRDHFVAQGVPAERIHLTGSPRYDRLDEARRHPAAAALTERLAGRQLVAVVTNPIDHQGFCSTSQKLDLVAATVADLVRLAERRPLAIVLRHHGGEDREAYARRLAEVGTADAVLIDDPTPLDPLLAVADAAVVMASTVGLEALLLGAALGVLAIPGHGAVHDYVAHGAALELSPTAGLMDRVADLLDGRGPAAERVDAYLDRHLTRRGGAADCVADLAHGLLASPGDRGRRTPSPSGPGDER